MIFTKSFTIQRRPEEAFEYFANVENEARFNPWAIEVCKISSGPVGPGSRFRGRYKRFGTVEQELTEYEPPRHLVWRSNTMGAATMTFDLEPNGSGTRVTVTGQANPPGLMKVVDPVMGLIMRPHMDDIVRGIQRELA